MTIVRHQPAKILSGAVEANGMVYVAGTVADRRPASVKAQTEEILGRIDALLAQAGSHKSRIVSAQIWLADIRTREEMNQAWLAWVDANNLPARACVEAKLASADALVEIAVIATK
jgi:enamine deaminase RidA (YjgF/YER057c/UK114 family)